MMRVGQLSRLSVSHLTKTWGLRHFSVDPAFDDLKLLKVTHQNYVYHLELSVPELGNTLTTAMWLELKSAFNRMSEEPQCRAIVFSSVGRDFCQGLELRKNRWETIVGYRRTPEEDVPRRIFKTTVNVRKHGQAPAYAMTACPKPIICSLHGQCKGAGLVMPAASDIRYASKDAMFSFAEIKFGIAADVGTHQLMTRIIGSDSHARELMLTGRSFNAHEALRLGFVNRIFDSKEELVAESFAMAEEIAKLSPLAVQSVKRSLNFARDHSLRDSLEWIANWNGAMLHTEDMHVTLKAMKDKKDPVYKDL